MVGVFLRDNGRQNSSEAAQNAQTEEFTEHIALRSQLLYGPLGEEVYLSYAPPNNPRYIIEMIDATFTGPGKESQLEARQTLWSNYEHLKEALSSNNSLQSSDLISHVYNELKPLKDSLAEKQLGHTRVGLGKHLQEVSALSVDLLLTDGLKSRFPTLLTDRQSLLVAYVVAPLHDSMKYLGTPSAQVIPDHEVLIGELTRTCFAGKFVAIKDCFLQLDGNDVEFVASVMSDHENIFKEVGRDNWINSPHATERAKALFSLIDTLAGAILPTPGESQHWYVSKDPFALRFINLCERHLEPDPLLGKVFRPEWVSYAVNDMITTFDKLESLGCRFSGTEPNTAAKKKVIDGALLAVRTALGENEKRRFTEPQERKGLVMSDDQFLKVVDLKSCLLGDKVGFPR